jgi:hypothetical protein
MKRLFLILFLIAAWGCVEAQEDSVRTQGIILEPYQDTVLIKSYAARFNPRRALMLSAVFPGLGQIYNKKYWKLPLVYGGGYLLWTGVDHYNGLYRQFRSELFTNLELGIGDNQTRPGDRLTTGTYRNLVTRTRRDRDFFIILLGALYVLQIVDAHVDAHLKEFDLNPNLQVRLEPMIDQNPVLGRQTGFSLVMRF